MKPGDKGHELRGRIAPTPQISSERQITDGAAGPPRWFCLARKRFPGARTVGRFSSQLTHTEGQP